MALGAPGRGDQDRRAALRPRAASSAARCSALGRALGETAAVLIIISPAYNIKINILEAGTQTISALIAGNFGNATKSQLSALLTAGLRPVRDDPRGQPVAAVIISRSRSGEVTEI